jgi:PAS domain S-box-containing protein
MKESQKDMEESKEGMFRELVEHTDDIIIVADEDFVIRYVTSSVQRVFGISSESLRGGDIRKFVDATKLTGWLSLLQGESHALIDELVQETNGETFYFDAHILKLADHYPLRGIIVKLHDVTDKKRKEQALIRSNQQLDQVIYKTTHDLKAPLMSALGLVNIAEQAPAGEQGQYIGMIKKSLQRLDLFLDEVNHFFRNEKLALQRERVNIDQLLQEEQEDLKNLYPGNSIAFDIRIAETAALFTDRVRIKTIVTNILSNAIKYRDLHKQNPFIKITVQVADDFCDICFEDNGIGIDPANQQKIFDLFYRATDQSHGSGLGLFLVKDTVERLKGTISVKSTVGVGTIFQVRIPNQLHHQPVEVDQE